jgi:hypothetical protein
MSPPTRSSQPTVSPRAVRWVAIVVGAIGIAGIIIGSILNNTGLAITAGIVSAIAIGYLIVLTAAVGREAFESGDHEPTTAVDDELARDVEERVADLVAAGADERKVRQLVTRAVELGRDRRRVG